MNTIRSSLVNFSRKNYQGIVFPYGFSSVYKESKSELYLYYSLRKMNSLMPSSIGVAFSKDGLHFTNLNASIFSNQKQFSLFHVATPAVAKIGSSYIMIFSGRQAKFDPLSLYMAISVQPTGPFEIVSKILEPNFIKESFWIDNGPSIAFLSNRKLIVYYSNTQKKPLDFIRGYLRREIRIFEIIINNDPFSFKVKRLRCLSNLNGKRGEWNESLFCPGYLKMEEKHYLFPATGIYSIRPFPSQSIGLFESSNPLFLDCTSKIQLVNGKLEREKLYPSARGEIGLDTPSPILVGNNLYLYFSIVDRVEGKWMTALLIFE